MPELLFTFKGGENRDKAHRALEDVLAEGKHPGAECRELPDDVYEVWSGPAPRPQLEEEEDVNA